MDRTRPWHPTGPYAPPAEPTSLNLVAQSRAQPATARRDLAALGSFKEVLRGLVWAEQALSPHRQLTYAEFFTELVGAIEAAGYLVSPETEAILVANVIQARGVPFQAVAVLGLAEGSFPTALSEDPLLRDADRRRLNDLGLALDLATESAEIEFFYETIARPWDQLCLTRPRLADNGALWQPSPYWEEVRRLVDIEPDTLGSDSAPPPDRIASWPELLESLSSYFEPGTTAGYQEVWDWVSQTRPEAAEALTAAAELFSLRYNRAAGSPYDGQLGDLADEFGQRFGPQQTWSASRLETYRSCPLMFYVGHVLKLEPRPEPVEGLDARQLGNLYHHILERVYRTVDDPVDLEQLLAALPEAAASILDDAPQREGFRATAWWAETRTAIEDNVRQSLIALAEKGDGYLPVAFEQAFFQERALTVHDGDDFFRLHGYIDRVDRGPDGTVRIIDYKTGGPTPFTNRAVQEGKKLQLPLYALAARDALSLGQPADGFYWHIQHAEPSSFTLRKFKAADGDSGPEAALRTVVDKAWEAVRSARAGHFAPQPPAGGCPSYCPAAAFCWHYQPGFGG